MNSIHDILNQKTDDLLQDNPQISTKLDFAEPDEPTDEPNEEKKAVDIVELKNTIHQMKDQLEGMLRTLDMEEKKISIQENPDVETLETGERVIEGVFNGEKMVGGDGKKYSIPPNYASKSKLVEGDLMKLTITTNGSFVYKQIGPIERKRLTAELISNPKTEQWDALASGGKRYKVLTASVTFFQGKAGDEAVILVPKDGESTWAAIENVINR